jgi:SNF2 family DNA or RNA helicase
VKLHDYQLVAVDFLRGRDRAGLFLDMGLGKTACVLSALEPRHLPALVVAPKRVAETVWDAERDLWRPDLTISLAVGEPAARQAALDTQSDITVISRDNLMDARKVRSRYKTIVLDELSNYKTKSSKRWRTARDLIDKPATQHVWGLTGTPSPNGYLDLWAQIYLLDRGKRLGKTLGGFRGRYFIPIIDENTGFPFKYEPRPETDKNVQKLIEDICLAMETEGRIALPPVTRNEIHIELPAEVRRVYNEMQAELVVDLREIFGGQIHSAKNAATLTNRLSQIAAGFMYVDDAWMYGGAATRIHNQKLDVLKEVVGGVDSPVLVFYQYVEEKDAILQDPMLGPLCHDINDPGVIQRWNKGDVPVLISHPASASHGLNLQYGGHTIVWTSPTWDLELWEQGNKRLARQGQQHPVVIHVILADGTIDTRVIKRVDGKAEVQDDLLAFLESPV